MRFRHPYPYSSKIKTPFSLSPAEVEVEIEAGPEEALAALTRHSLPPDSPRVG